MTGIIIMLVLVVVGTLVKKANDRARRATGQAAPWTRVQYGMQRVQQWAAPPPVPQPLQPAPLTSTGQYPGSQYAVQYAQPPGQFQPAQPYFGPGGWQPPMAPHHTDPSQLPRHRTPSPQADVDARVRELMAAGHEVAAVRLLCDEADLGIIEAQQYARNLTLPPGQEQAGRRTAADGTAGADDAESRYVGSAAFATSVFDTGDDDVWASGWRDTAEPDDRTDMDELWRTVRDAGKPPAADTPAPPAKKSDASTFDISMEL